MAKHTLTLLCLLTLIAWPAGPARAHSLHVFAYLDGDQLKGEGAYDDGTLAEQARIRVRDADGQPVGSSETDSEGTFALKLEAGRAPFLVEIDDGAGHRGTFEFTPEAAAPTAQPKTAAPGASVPGTAPGSAGLSREEVGDLLQRELAPIGPHGVQSPLWSARDRGRPGMDRGAGRPGKKAPHSP